MNFKPVSPIYPRYNGTKIINLLTEIQETEGTVFEISYAPGEYKSPYTASSSIKKCIKAHRFFMNCFVRDGKLYVVKETPIPKKIL